MSASSPGLSTARTGPLTARTSRFLGLPRQCRDCSTGRDPDAPGPDSVPALVAACAACALEAPDVTDLLPHAMASPPAKSTTAISPILAFMILVPPSFLSIAFCLDADVAVEGAAAHLRAAASD